MLNGKDIQSPMPHENQTDPFQTTATFLISTNNITNYELVDPRNCFHVITDEWYRGTWLVFPGHVWPIQKPVLPLQWYKLPSCQLSFRIPLVWGSTTRFFSTMTLICFPFAFTNKDPLALSPLLTPLKLSPLLSMKIAKLLHGRSEQRRRTLLRSCGQLWQEIWQLESEVSNWVYWDITE